MKRTVFQKLGDFVLGKGFYIVLFLCVATIGISGYYLVRTVSSTPGEAEPVTGSPIVVLPDSSQNAAPPHTTPSVTTPTAPTVTEPEDSGSQEASLPQTVEEEPAETVQPVEEDPVPAVFTISAGTVQGVYDDDLMGTCVVVDHGDGLTSIYCNLSAKPTVSEGDTVSTGTVLGVVGETAIAESSRPSHLHLEMAQDGKAVDPVSYLPQR